MLSFDEIVTNNPSNPFLALANAMCHQGWDMEDVARSLAIAFNAVASEATNGNTPEQEYRRFSAEG